MKKYSIFIIIFILLHSLSFADNTTAINVNFGKFFIAESFESSFLYQYQPINGNGVGIKIKRFKKDGIKSTFYSVYSLRIFDLRGGGIWRQKENDYPTQAYFKMNQINFTYSAILNILPSFVVAPYIGIGIGVGVAKFEGNRYYIDQWQEHDESYKYQSLIPVIKLPMGISIRPNNNFEIEIEGGFENGFYFSWGTSFIF